MHINQTRPMGPRRVVLDYPQLLTIDEAAQYLRVTPQTVYRLLGRRLLPGVKVGGQWRIGRADLDVRLKVPR